MEASRRIYLKIDLVDDDVVKIPLQVLNVGVDHPAQVGFELALVVMQGYPNLVSSPHDVEYSVVCVALHDQLQLKQRSF